MLAAILLSILATPWGCATRPADLPVARVHRAPAPGPEEPWCAWFGDVGGDTLYFGISAFWGASRAAGGDPRADLRVPGPQPIGRFDLERERFEPPLLVGPADAPGGVWDVLVHPDGTLWFTTFFGTAGRVDPGSGAVERLEAAGTALNELALAGAGTVVASRYRAHPDGDGEVLVLGPDGAVRARLRLPAPPGLTVAAKSVAWDPLRDEIWVNTDLLGPGGEARGHDARILDPQGRERMRFRTPELQFVTFGPDGTGWFAERDGPRLRLRIRPPGRAASPLPTGTLVALDDAFPATDFVQEIRGAADGSALVTRWSGRLHHVLPDGSVRDVQLPRGPDALYYTAVRHDGRICATRCGEVAVVCRDLDGPGG
ncbi:MAG: hypothetical protein R3263_00665 [Myxococcota bacterium]|nr:hypothetical protein [Myxococcota bacterium]